ncbi:hypothetical protein L198_05001 [Cryptococcus wingfieldii CBS 7118]|uniref:Rad21/Rec8-like protein N-terminal domain-containing protein n=1 Tax=Cryptococcus wingfieldii CBS 7118 TaxID=1295528 RepID=A0A1E3J1V2_9TREE|nr:hypothetical protein L198_05001 [Cryptococcus wingfieldii CBS 7118]ODN94853.1 hypothetical protein L198_05001 [Cryptococcus wingfieldii CBS 7118]
MFFSDDLLTTKKGSFGIVWLMATLGPRNKKITKKQLAAVDLAKTCELIAEPPEPMALRLSGALLVGVARVYNQSFDMFYADVTTFHANLRRSIAIDLSHPSNTMVGGGALELPNDGQIRSELITIGNTDFDWDMSSWDAEFAHVDWNDPLAPGRKRRASSVLSSSQISPASERDGVDTVEDGYVRDLEEEEDYEFEVGRMAKRSRFSASPAYTTLHRTPIHQRPPSNPLFSRNDLDFQQEVDLGLNLDLDFDGPAGVDDSFSGPSGGRGFEMPLAPMDDYDIGPDMPALMDNMEGPVIFYDEEGGPLGDEQQLPLSLRQPSPNANDLAHNDDYPGPSYQKRKAKQIKKVVFDSSLEINEDEERQARSSYRERMAKDRKDAESKEAERRLGLEVISMVDGAGGFQFYDAEMADMFSSLTKVARFKWEADLARSKSRRKGLISTSDQDIDIDERKERHAVNFPHDFDMPMAPMDDYDVQAGYMQDARQLPDGEVDFGQNDAYYPPIYDDYEVPVRDRDASMARLSDVEYGRRDSVRSGGNLPWEITAGSTPGGAYPDFADTSFSPGSLKFSLMTPQEARIRQNSRSGNNTGSQFARRHRIRSSSLMSDRPDDDPLMLARARSAELDLPSDVDLEDILPSETQQARLADLPDAFRPEMLATLEKQCRDFLTYMEKKMIGLKKENIMFDELVPRTSKKNWAAVAFYDCLTLSTKNIISVDQPEPWDTIHIRFADKPSV